ncbi:MAG: AAA domain-containing protein [Candidatus Sericytochromatia bacterium]
MESTLQKYRNRLVNLSSRNRALVLKKLHTKRAFDLTILNKLSVVNTEEIINFLLSRDKTSLKLLHSPYTQELTEDEMSELITLSKSLKNIRTEIDLVNKERGSYDLYIGYLFIEGKFLDKTFVKAPLLLFPIKISEVNSEWFLTNIEQNALINRTFVMAYQQYNGVKLSEFDLEIDTFDSDFLEILLDYLSNNGIKIKSDNFSAEIESFQEYKTKDIPDYKLGDLFLKNNLILGQFPVSANALNEDYIKLIESPPTDGLVHSLLNEDNEIIENEDFEKEDDKIQINEGELFLLTDVDYSQEKAIFASNINEQLVIYGPPGTGKSQVIVNLIADNLAKGKNILMVSQKRAALDVVYNRLSKFGLKDRIGFVHDYNLDWKEVFKKVINVLEAQTGLYSQDEHKELFNASLQIEEEIRKLDHIANLLHTRTDFGLSLFQMYSRSKNDLGYYIDNLSDNFEKYRKLTYSEVKNSSEKINGIIKYLRFDFESSEVKDRNDFSSFPEIEKERIQLKLENLEKCINTYFSERLNEENLTKYLIENFNLNKLDRAIVLLREEIDSIKNINKIINIDKYNKFSEIKAKYSIIKSKENWVFNHKSSNEDFENFVDFIEININELKDLSKIIDKDKFSNFNEIKDNYLIAKNKKWWSLSYWKSKSYLKNLFQENDFNIIFKLVESTIKFIEIKQKIENTLKISNLEYSGYTEKTLRILDNNLKEIKGLNESFIFIKSHFEEENLDKVFDLINETIKFNTSKDKIQNEFGLILEYTGNTEKILSICDNYYKEIKNILTIFEKISHLNLYFKEEMLQKFKFIISKGESIENKIKELKFEIDANFNDIKTFDKIKHELKEYEKDFIDFCKNKFSENTEELKKSEKSILNTFYLKHIEDLETLHFIILENIPKELTIRGFVKEKIKRKKEILPKYIIDKLNEKIETSKTYNRSGTEITYKNMRYEAGKQRNRMTLRKFITEFHDKGLFNIFPCWLVTPEVSSALFPLQQGLFDIVIFDEASQMFVENGIPALHRAKKVVIAGDDKQLQPNNLYQVKLEEDFETEEDDEYSDISALEAKSLLDLAKVKYKDATLTYHYRSLYQELINFSNYAFYNGRIEIIPNRINNPYFKSVERIKIEGKWVNRKNKEEAVVIGNLINKILVERENKETIGVITFNSTQKDCIVDLLEQESRLNSEFRELYQKEIDRKEGDEDVSLFIKNIENVQGDERDIIIFSIGYAPNEQGKILMNFGSLSQESGENRLNVAVSRAKRKIYVVTSIEPEDLNVDSLKNMGPKLFKNIFNMQEQ